MQSYFQEAREVRHQPQVEDWSGEEPKLVNKKLYSDPQGGMWMEKGILDERERPLLASRGQGRVDCVGQAGWVLA